MQRSGRHEHKKLYCLMGNNTRSILKLDLSESNIIAFLIVVAIFFLTSP